MKKLFQIKKIVVWPNGPARGSIQPVGPVLLTCGHFNPHPWVHPSCGPYESTQPVFNLILILFILHIQKSMANNVQNLSQNFN